MGRSLDLEAGGGGFDSRLAEVMLGEVMLGSLFQGCVFQKNSGRLFGKNNNLAEFPDFRLLFVDS